MSLIYPEYVNDYIQVYSNGKCYFFAFLTNRDEQKMT